MFFPRTRAWTPLQRWLVVSLAIVVIAGTAAGIYTYERHHRGPGDAVFVGLGNSTEDGGVSTAGFTSSYAQTTA